MLGDEGLGNFELLHEFVHAAGVALQELDDAEPKRVRERLEECLRAGCGRLIEHGDRVTYAMNRMQNGGRAEPFAGRLQGCYAATLVSQPLHRRPSGGELEAAG
jgi:hypothetical protein